MFRLRHPEYAPSKSRKCSTAGSTWNLGSRAKGKSKGCEGRKDQLDVWVTGGKRMMGLERTEREGERRKEERMEEESRRAEEEDEERRMERELQLAAEGERRMERERELRLA